MRFPYLGFLTWKCLIRPSLGVIFNATIDDTVPDPLTGLSITYSPAEAWNSGADCKKYTAHPIESRVHNGTWHESTFDVLPGSNSFPNETLSASAEFDGTAVYVFCLLARAQSSPTGNSDMSFFIDGELVGTFVKPAPGTMGYDYNTTVYSNTTLSPGRHKITIQNGHVNGPKSLLMLDRIVYTMSRKNKPNSILLGVVISALLGTLAFAAIGLTLLFIRRQHKRRLNSIETELKFEPLPATTFLLAPLNPTEGPNYPSDPGHNMLFAPSQGTYSMPHVADDYDSFNPYTEYHYNASHTSQPRFSSSGHTTGGEFEANRHSTLAATSHRILGTQSIGGRNSRAEHFPPLLPNNDVPPACEILE